MTAPNYQQSRWRTLFTNHNQRPIPRLLEIAITCGLLLALGAPRLLALDQFVTTDERLWLERSGRFYYALAHRDFAATFQKSHPGVTVMWAGLTGYLRVYPEYRENWQEQDRPIGLGILQKRAFDLPLQILAAGRRTKVLMGLLVLGLSFLFARRLFGMLPALTGFMLIAFDPFHIALSKVLHLDELVADLMFLSLLAFLVYLNENRKAAFAVSAAAAGLAWLTKSTGLFLIPLIALLALFDQLYLKKDWNRAEWRKHLLRFIGRLAAWGGIAALTFFVLWPSMWVDPLGSLVRILADAIGYAQGGHESAVFFNGKIYPNGQIPDISFYLISFLWRTTPMTLLGLLAAAVFFIRKKPANLQDYLIEDYSKWAVAALLLLALGFGALMTLGLKKFDRYILPSIPPLDLIAGMGLVWLAQWIGQFIRDKRRTAVSAAILLACFAVQAALAWNSYPYFFNYYNPLLGGSQRAVNVMQIGWGEGLDQAARYINDKQDSEKIRVMAWYAGGPFSYFSKSQVSALDVDHTWSDEDWEQFNKSDYVVVYIHEWQRDIPAEVLDRLRDSTPEYSVWINGLEYVRVYKIR